MSDVDLVAGVRSALIGGLEGQCEALKASAEPLSEADFWRKPLEPGNSVGHLVLHLTGNLNHFVGRSWAAAAMSVTASASSPTRVRRGRPRRWPASTRRWRRSAASSRGSAPRRCWRRTRRPASARWSTRWFTWSRTSPSTAGRFRTSCAC